MKRLPAHLLSAGFQLPGAVRDPRGRVLIPAGVTITDDHLRQLGTRTLYGGDDWPASVTAAGPGADGAAGSGEGRPLKFTLRRSASGDAAVGPAVAAQPLPIEGGVTSPEGAARPAAASSAGGAGEESLPAGAIGLESLRIGAHTTRDLYSPSGVLLLAAGTGITARFVELLQQHQVRWVQFSPTPGGGEAPAARGPDGRLTTAALAVEVRAGLARHAKTATHLRGVCQELSAGRDPSGVVLTDSVQGFLDQLTLDRDVLAAIVAMQRSQGSEYLYDHCLNTALTSLSIAAQLHLDREQTFQLGLAALLADIGMLHVPDPIRLAGRPLTPAELAEVRRHPIVSSGRIEHISHLPEGVAIVAGQAHEREDGSGYPRGRDAGAIHPLAKIVAVADAFCAMTRARPYRAALPRHEAMRCLLHEGHAGRLDRQALRGLLDAVSAFPIGCIVELSDARSGEVVRPNRGAHTRPVVRLHDAQGAPTDALLDLRAYQDVAVVSVRDPGMPAVTVAPAPL